MKRSAFLTLLLALACALALSACQTTGSTARKTSAPAQPQAAQDPMANLGGKMLLLPDGRDISYSVVRVSGMGIDVKAVREAAKNMTFADFDAFLGDYAQAHRVVYLGTGRFRVDALRYTLGEEYFDEASYTLHLSRFVAAGNTVDGIIIDTVVLNGRDLTEFAALKTYEHVLMRKAGL